MSGPGQGGGGFGGPGSGHQGGSPNQVATSTSTTYPASTTLQSSTASSAEFSPTSASFTSTTSTSPSASLQSSTSSTSSKIQKPAIIGGVIGGLAGLSLICLLALWLLQWRKKKLAEKKNRTAEPVTYAGVNASFAGVPFAHSNNSGQRDPLLPSPDSPLPPPPLFAPRSSTTREVLGIRGGGDVEGNGYSMSERVSEVSTDPFLPSYLESQSALSVGEYRDSRRDSHGDSLERVGTHRLTTNESPLLGEGSLTFPQTAVSGAGGVNNGLGVGRMNTQRTVSTVSSMGISVVSDGELERLGVGSRARAQRYI